MLKTIAIMLKRVFCSICFHVKTVQVTEELPGKEFRYVSKCACGNHVIKSVPLHDNDLLANINITPTNFPVEKKIIHSS